VLAAAGGHIFPIQLGFRGGKGIGVSLGALAVFDWRIAAGSMLLCAVLYLVSRRYMLSGMISVLTVPIAAVVLGLPTSSSVILAVWAGLILLAHRKNLFDLYQDKTHSEGDKPYGDGENGDRRIHI
jgi:glycerol-3-phosphate acyltransferase PlsY